MKWIIFGQIIGLVILYALSWILTCGLVYLITLCFGFSFSWTIATGVWLILCVIKKIFNH